MKKIYQIFMVLTLMTVVKIATAQSNFFTPTTYRGAFAPAPVAMWTNGWTEWDPQNKNYGTPNVDVAANITSNTTWTSGNIYHLKGVIYVKNGATLTIQPGTVIMGDKNTPNSSLIITKGAKINAAGTSSSPIVFTSNQPAGQRNLGDWGGIILLGKATNNQPGDTAYIEGLTPTPDTQFGGGANPDDNDNSGTLQYVRVEFAGYVFQPNKEINGITFGSVGRATTVDHIQVSFSNDDSYEWFGGTVNCKYLISFRGLDDDFDTDFGYSGLVQFGLAVRDPQLADNPAVSTSEGFESDNDATGTTATPQTKAMFCNMTIIGPFRGNTASTIAAGYRRGARIRRNSALKIFNSVFMDHPRGIHIDGTLCEQNATADVLKFKYNIVAGNSTSMVTEVNSGSTFNARAWFGTSHNDSLVSTTGILTTPYNYTAPDYRPASGSPAASGADFQDAAFSGLMATPVKPTAAFTANQNTGSGSRAFNFTNTTNENGNVTTYLWDFGVTTSTGDTSTQKNPSFSFPSNGTYTVRLIAYSAVGNDTTTQTVNVLATGVVDQNISSIMMYPNPAQSNLNLQLGLNQTSAVAVSIFDLTGRVVKTIPVLEMNAGNNQLNVNVNDLTNGVYLVQVATGNSSNILKLIISR
ncbi:MAG: T9SS type A sorting domain-containing protein [Bacteroidia bacterium]|nr:T9SS type A sorting domain-containing protein [Bacteroidia bacterium]